MHGWRRRAIVAGAAVPVLLSVVSPAIAGADVLHDQMSAGGGIFFGAVDFDADNAYDSQGADDFVVPAGEAWTIDTVEVGGTGPAASVDVFIYSNVASGGVNLPGPEVFSELGATSSTPSDDLLVSIGPVTLGPGTYWLSVQPNNPWPNWWWWEAATQTGNPSVWRNPGDGLATGCTDWGRRVADCGFGSGNPDHPDFAFLLLGDSTPAPSDTTAPTISITTPADGASFMLGTSAIAAYVCADEVGGSGLAFCAGPVAEGAAIDTGTVGAKSFTVNATDHEGNASTLTNNYAVVFDYAGFFAPVDNTPTANLVKAGAAVPVKFSLSGDQGLDVFATGYPKSAPTSCSVAGAVDGIEETVTAGSSSLSYDAATNQYTYVWKTQKGWSNTCRQLVLGLTDGSHWRANFQFK